MFDFDKLIVYKKSKSTVTSIQSLIDSKNFSKTVNDQLGRASLSILLNIAEGNSRFSKKDKRRFLIISRGSVFECAALIDYLRTNSFLESSDSDLLISQLEEISKMLFGMIRKLE